VGVESLNIRLQTRQKAKAVEFHEPYR
jgi:hypothetical protein